MAIYVVEPGQVEAEGRRPKAMTFREAQEVVGGFVEAIPLSEGYVLVNEEGRIRGMRPNAVASRKAGINLVGPAIFLTDEDVYTVLGGPDDEGE